jgi:hypothetical protein
VLQEIMAVLRRWAVKPLLACSVLPAGTIIGEGGRRALVRSAMGELFGNEHGIFSCGEAVGGR